MRLLFRLPGTVFTDKFGVDETDIFRMAGVSALFGGNAAAFKRQVPERNRLCNEFSVKSQRVPERGGS